MHTVLVSSPGHGGGRLHWSHAAAAAVAQRLVAAGHAVTWLATVHAPQRSLLAPAPAGVERRALVLPARAAAHRVAATNRHPALERELTSLLRRHPASPVVHLGIGAWGSPNVPWLAERLGSRAVAVANAAEVWCPRGERAAGAVPSGAVPAGGVAAAAALAPCAQLLATGTCARCCVGPPWRRVSAAALRARSDLLAGSLLASAAVLVQSAEDVEPLVAFGVPRPAIEVGVDPAAIAARATA